MTTTYEGSITLGAAVPGAASAAAGLTTSANASIGEVQAKVTGLTALSASITLSPPDPLALIAQAQALIAALSVPIPALPAPPQLVAIASTIAELSITLASLQASLDLAASLTTQLGTPGIHYYLFAGRADAAGGELSAHLSAGLPGGNGPSESIAGAILLASDAGAINALRSLLRS